jgi:tetratricopeptide (TPR) repeat protein
MKARHTGLILSVLAISTLGGCQNIWSSNHRLADRTVEDLDLSGYFALRLEEGRIHLQANRPGAAIYAYRQASYDPDLRAAAYNGMAIAFDRLGRTDLAQSYFMAAVQIEPENVSFASNFVHFSEAHSGEALAVRSFDPAIVDAQLAGEAATRELAAASVGEPSAPSGTMSRISEREVHIAARGEVPSLVPARAGRAPAINVERRAAANGRDAPHNPLLAALSDADGAAARGSVTAPERAPRRARTRVLDTRGRDGYPLRFRLRDS